MLMVCLGNICRSPTAHGVLESLVSKAGLSHAIEVDSAGTANFHVGKSPDPRSMAAAAKRGYDLRVLKARQVAAKDFLEFDYVFAMDAENLKVLEGLRAQGSSTKLKSLCLLLNNSEEGASNVPDPYYSGEEGFELVLDLVESACRRLLDEIVINHEISRLAFRK